MKKPAINFYTSDFLSGVANLTMEERGQYITMLCLQHQQGHLSKKIIKLNIGKVSADVLNKFEIDKNGDYYNIRLEEEIEKKNRFIEHQRENGLKGGRPRKEEKPKETQPLNQNEPNEKPLEIGIGNINNNLYIICNYIENNYGNILTPLEISKIEKWVNNFDIELIKKAIDISIENNSKRINYVNKILENWKVNGIKSIKDIPKLKTKKVEEVPEWFDKEIEKGTDPDKIKKIKEMLKC